MLEREQVEKALIEHGLADSGDSFAFEPLAGGVSCDVFRVTAGDRCYCVKAALAKLRVEADWHVSPRRAHVEAQWLETAAAIGVPAPELLFEDRKSNAFVMRFVEDAAAWKAELMSGRVDVDFAGELGGVLARMHARTLGDEAVAGRFANADLFEDLRIAPFLLFSADRHPAHGDRLRAIADRTRRSGCALIHGDFSPKNILVTGEGPVILDAECATWGDPAFDLAFCLAHLILKAQALPAHRVALLDAARRFAEAHATGTNFESAFEARAIDLVSALMLARIDGKSPVEYLEDEDRQRVREQALSWLDQPPGTIAGLLSELEIKEAGA